MILIGSEALKYHYDDYYTIPKDVDIIGTEKEFDEWMSELDIDEKPTRKEFENLVVYNFHMNNRLYEFEIANNNSAEDYLKYCNDVEGEFEIAPVEVLYSIKKSHIHKQVNFQKHIKDYHFLKNRKVDDSAIEEITKKRKTETDIRLKSRFPKLNKKYDVFVKESQDVLKRVFDHDDLHRIVAYYDEPIYMSLQKGDNQVWCEKDIWEQLSFDDKIKCVLEEVYVITLERKIVPMLYQKHGLITKENAVEWAIIRTYTTLSSGWFSQFIIDNYFEIKNNVNYDFLDNFFEELDKENVKHYINSKYK